MKSILIIKNEKKYKDESARLIEMGSILYEMEYGIFTIDSGSEAFERDIHLFFEDAKKTIECKAVLTCNAEGIELVAPLADCIYVTYLSREVDGLYDKLLFANKKTKVFCSDMEWMSVLKNRFPNIGEVFYTELKCAFDETDVAQSEQCLLDEAQFTFDIQELIAVSQGDKGILKLLIQRGLESQELAQVKGWIEQYEMLCPKDLDLFSMKTIYELCVGDVEKALEYAKAGVRQYPCNADLRYNLGNAYEALNEWFLAWVEYNRANIIYNYCKDKKAAKMNLETIISDCRKQCELNPDDREHAGFEEMAASGFGLNEIGFRNPVRIIIGDYYWETESTKRYVGIYRDYFLRKYKGHGNLVHLKGEFVEATEGTSYEIPSGTGEVLMPIACENDETRHKVVVGEKEYEVCQGYGVHFNYYRIPEGTRILSSGKSYYGKPIALQHKKERKKLVLNIFVDGLAQCVLDKEKFEKNMPNTARFFEKGTICTRAYNTAEWTYPSIVNYVTGLDTPHHMLFHNILDGAMPQDYPTLPEYFHEQGYFTAKLCGNWRIIPTYGHARGYDQFIYQHQWVGYKAETMIGEVIDHIEAFKETDQFLWMSIGDLHDVADGIDMPNSVQSVLGIENCIAEETGPTSVKQEYSAVRSETYQVMLRRVDKLLKLLYEYLEEQYKDEEILVSLFSDHGQGYLVPLGEHFCAEQRSRVAFMFRGAGVEKQITDEVMSTSDYIKIMCKLANIEMKDLPIAGVLPKGFGGEGREYALTESIHPGDVYNAAIYDEKHVFYFTNPFPVQNDGRFYLKQYETKLTDLQGHEVENEEVKEKYLNIILDHIAPLCIYD